jgi:hypothetical protein
MASLFQSTPQVLYEPDDSESLAQCLVAQLATPEFAGFTIPDWQTLAVPMAEAYARHCSCN